jgi:fatty acid desaturase
MGKESVEELLKQSIAASDRTTAASNRTTRAVRAFVRFLFIQLVAITIAIFLNTVATLDYQNPIVALQLVAFVVWLVGLIWSSYAGWSELELSNPEGNTLQEPTPEATPITRKPPSGNALEDRNWL